MPTLDPEIIFAELESDRAFGKLRRKILGNDFGYQSSKTYSRLLEKVDANGNVVAVGKYQDGGFVEIDIS